MQHCSPQHITPHSFSFRAPRVVTIDASHVFFDTDEWIFQVFFDPPPAIHLIVLFAIQCVRLTLGLRCLLALQACELERHCWIVTALATRNTFGSVSLCRSHPDVLGSLNRCIHSRFRSSELPFAVAPPAPCLPRFPQRSGQSSSTMALRMEPLPESLADSKAPAYALRNLLWRWWVPEEAIFHFAASRPAGEGCQHISDFASLYTDASYEAKLETAVRALENFKDDEPEVSRPRTAWGVARA